MCRAATPGYYRYCKTAPNVQDDRRRDKNWKTSAVLGILALVGLVALSGCKSSSEPSSDQAQKIVEASYRDLTPVGIKIIDFRKQNGEAKVVEGQKTYIYHFLVAFELPAGIVWNDYRSLHGLTAGFVKNPGPALGESDGIHSLKAGGTGVGMGTITFRVTEQGWTADSPFTMDDGYCQPQTSPKDCYKKLGWDKLN
jgi:hypothetical protein